MGGLAYVLFFAGFLLLAGRVADLWGRRRTFVVGLAVFTAASLCCGLSVSKEMMVVSRAFQGLGAATTAPAALSIITTIFAEGRERDRAVAAWTAVAAGGGAAGLLLGGFITDVLGWEWIFFVNVPVGVAAIALSHVLLPESRDPAASRRLDLLGAGTVTSGLVLLVLALTRTEEAGFGSPTTLATLGLAATFFGAFVFVERRAADPLVPLGLFRLRGLVGAALVAFALTAATAPVSVLVTLYLQNTLGYSASFAGLAGLPFSLCVIAGSMLGGRISGRIGGRVTMSLGLAVVAVSALLTAGISAEGGLRARGRRPLRVGVGLRFGRFDRSRNLGGGGREARSGLGFHEHLRASGNSAGIGGPPHPRGYPHRRAIRWCGVRGRGAGSRLQASVPGRRGRRITRRGGGSVLLPPGQRF